MTTAYLRWIVVRTAAARKVLSSNEAGNKRGKDNREEGCHLDENTVILPRFIYKSVQAVGERNVSFNAQGFRGINACAGIDTDATNIVLPSRTNKAVDSYPVLATLVDVRRLCGGGLHFWEGCALSEKAAQRKWEALHIIDLAILSLHNAQSAQSNTPFGLVFVTKGDHRYGPRVTDAVSAYHKTESLVMAATEANSRNRQRFQRTEDWPHRMILYLRYSYLCEPVAARRKGEAGIKREGKSISQI
ncbi:hypothetical protein FB451DRAFT_1467280 [Mycena latifolia]|nr:hypothetical protein FB451DRAFT_1467280 [Mycena latifolia]